MNYRHSLPIICSCVFAACLLPLWAADPAAPVAPQAPAASAKTIDLDKAIAITLPDPAEDLKPMAFKSPDGKSGWVLKIPGKNPIATPAFADGTLFVGGGYGSTDFYAFSAKTGDVKWQIDCDDDGPTFAAVEDGVVAFNTESCDFILVDARTGKILWQQWLGDPLMGAPAIANGKVYAAYPDAHPGKVFTPDAKKPNGPAGMHIPAGAAMEEADGGPLSTVGPAKTNGYRLFCADLKTGKHLWEQDLAGEVISAPVIDGNSVAVTCFDGTTYLLDAASGAIAWKHPHEGTSAPLLVAGEVITTRWQNAAGNLLEGIVRLDLKAGTPRDDVLLAGGAADYLKPGNRGNLGLSPELQDKLDQAVGFGGAIGGAGGGAGGAHRGAAGAGGGAGAGGRSGLGVSGGHAGGKSPPPPPPGMTDDPKGDKDPVNVLNLDDVSGGWAYQGPKPAYAHGRIFNCQGATINCLDANTGKPQWQIDASGKGIDRKYQSFVPPALGKANLYCCSTNGHIFALDQATGELKFAYMLNVPIIFQMCLANGAIFVGTIDGRLICLETGNPDADGWSQWGGNAQHNTK